MRMKKSLFFGACLFISGALLMGCGSQANGLNLPAPPEGSGGNGGQQTYPGKEDPENPPADPGIPGNDAAARSLSMGAGWNLGNQLDAYEESPRSKDYLMPSETVWGNPVVTATAIQKVHDAGFTTIRIPVTWLAKIGPALDYQIDAKWMARVTEVVGYALDAGFKNVLIDLHHDGCHDGDYTDDGRWLDVRHAAHDAALNEQIKKKIRAVWSQIATNFKDHDERLIFEGFNEIQDGEWGESDEFKSNPSLQCNILNEWQKVFVETVRACGGYNETRWLGIAPYIANPKYAQYLVMPDDPAGRLMLDVHFYDPDAYTLGRDGKLPYSDWGHTGASDRKYRKYDEDHVQETFRKLRDNYIAKGIPVYIGEWGCARRDKENDPRGWAFSLYYMEYVAKAARTYGLPINLWDCGGKGVPGVEEHHFYFWHDTGEYYKYADEAVAAMLKGWCTEDPDYTLESVYNSAPKF